MSRTARQNTWHPQLDTHPQKLPEVAQSIPNTTLRGRHRALLKRSLLLASVLLAGVVFSITAYSADTSGVGVCTRPKVIIGADDTIAPYSFLKSNGEPSGFCIELLRAVGSATGLDYEVRLAPWDEIRAALEAGEIDAVAAMVYSEEREKEFDFSPPYAIMHHSVFKRPGAPDIRWEEDLMGKDIVVVRGTIMHDYVLRKGFTDNPALVDSSVDALLLLSRVEHDYALLPKLSAVYWAEQLRIKDVEATGSPLGPGELCFAVRKGNKELLAKLNEGLAIVNASGRQREICDEWFGPLDPDVDAETLGIPVKIGVLATNGRKACHARWGLTADYLTEKVKGYSFEIVPLEYDEVVPAVSKGEVDFVLANPALYVEIEKECGAVALTTLKNFAAGKVSTECAGVIFCRGDSDFLNSLEDVRGRSVAAVDARSFGRWMTAWREFKARGIDPYHDLKYLSFLGSDDAVVSAVLDGKADVGIVRNGILDQMRAEGRFRGGDLSIVSQWTGQCDLPFRHSTRCYPEWPFASLQHTSTQLAEHVAAALMDMQANSPAAHAAKCAGWSIPSNYEAVHECLKELGVGPYKDFGNVSLAEVWRHYWPWILTGVALILAMALVAAWVVRLNRGLIRTIAEKDRAEDALKKSEEVLRDEAVRRRVLIEQSRDGIVVMDRTGKVYEANRKYSEMLGYTPEETLELYAWDWDALWPKEAILQMIEEVDETGDHFETMHRRKDGSTFPVEISSNAAMFGGQKLIFCVCRDITERKKAEADLVAHHEFLHTLVETIPLPVFCKDANLNFTICNKAFEEFYGKTRDEVIGRTVYAVTPREIAEKCDAKEKYLIKHPGTQRYEWQIPAADGRVRNIVFDKATFVDSVGNATGLVGIISDITDLKKAEAELKLRAEELDHARKTAEENAANLEIALNDVKAAEERRRDVEQQFYQAQKMESLGLLAGGVAHDFNNILQGILGHTALIKSGMEGKTEVLQHVRNVETAAYRAGQLTQRLLSFARKGKHNVVSLDPVSLIDEVVGFLGRTFNENIDILTEYDDDICPIAGDKSQIHQAIMNLCINAEHAMPDGGVLTIKAGNVTITANDNHGVTGANPGEYVVLTFQDTGVGMDEETLGRIFEPFFTTKTSGKGTGLGLSMVFGVVKNHGGIIDVSSTPGDGTAFRLLFPKERASDNENDSEQAADSPSSNTPEVEPLDEDLASKSVLIVDDEEVIRTVTPRMLKKMGMSSICASSGEEAIEIYRNSTSEIGIVILDMRMKGAGGLGTFRELKKINPSIRVIISSGYDEDANTQQVMREGALLFLKKPYPLETLLSAVRLATGSRETVGDKV